MRGAANFGHTELSASIWSPDQVRALRCALLAEHLNQDTGGLGDREALSLFRRIARENAQKKALGRRDWQGLAYTLDPGAWGA